MKVRNVTKWTVPGRGQNTRKPRAPKTQAPQWGLLRCCTAPHKVSIASYNPLIATAARLAHHSVPTWICHTHPTWSHLLPNNNAGGLCEVKNRPTSRL